MKNQAPVDRPERDRVDFAVPEQQSYRGCVASLHNFLSTKEHLTNGVRLSLHGKLAVNRPDEIGKVSFMQTTFRPLTMIGII